MKKIKFYYMSFLISCIFICGCNSRNDSGVNKTIFENDSVVVNVFDPNSSKKDDCDNKSKLVNWTLGISNYLEKGDSFIILVDDKGEIDLIINNYKKLMKLKEFDISGNKYRTLPKEFGELKNLEVVDAHYNDFKKLPVAICSLFNLKNLNLDGNNIGEIIDCLCLLPKLEVLVLTNNNLRSIPECLGELVLC